MRQAIIIFLLLISLSGCSSLTAAIYESPNPGALALGPRQELKLHFGTQSSYYAYPEEVNARLVLQEFDASGISGTEKAIWLMGIWSF
ncbi:MAG: hypothetical protein AB2L11_00710 [Syntrophobacteraceae bacterium]